MGKIKKSSLFKVISLVLILTFISLDISYAYPLEHNAGNSTLATPSVLQQMPINEQAARFQQSVFSQSALIASVYDISEYFFGNAGKGIGSLPSKYAEDAMRADLGKHLSDAGTEILNIVPVEYIKKTSPDKLKSALDEIGFKGRLPDEGVVFILYRKGDKKFLVQIAKTGEVSPANLPGYEWVVSDKYVVKYMPEDYIEDWRPQTGDHRPETTDHRPETTDRRPETKDSTTPPVIATPAEPPHPSLRGSEATEAISLSDSPKESSQAIITEPIAQIESPSAQKRSFTITPAKEKYSLSDDETKILQLALTYPGQGVDEDRAESIRINDIGTEYHGKGEYDKAIERYTRAIELDPTLATAYRNRGVTYNSLEQYDRAIEDLRRAIAINPGLEIAQDDLTTVFSNRAGKYDRSGDYEKAIEDYKRALEDDQGALDPYIQGLSLYLKGRHEEALTAFNRAVELEPKIAFGYQKRGLVYAAMGDHKKAIKEFDIALEKDPDYDMAYYNRGLCYAQNLRDYSRAIVDFEKAFKHNPRKEHAIELIKSRVAKKLNDLKEVQIAELFVIVKSAIPESMKDLLRAFGGLEPLSGQKSLDAGEISAAIAQAKERYSLSDDETKILWLALTGPGQGMGDGREAPGNLHKDFWPVINQLPALQKLQEKPNKAAGNEFVHVELVMAGIAALIAGDYEYILSKATNGTTVDGTKREKFISVISKLRDQVIEVIGQDEEKKLILKLMPMVHDIGKVDGNDGHWTRGAEMIDAEIFQMLQKEGYVFPPEIKKTLTLLVKHHFSIGEIHTAANRPNKTDAELTTAIGYIDGLVKDIDESKQDFNFIMTLLSANLLGDLAQGFLSAESLINKFSEVIKYNDRDYLLSVQYKLRLEQIYQAHQKITAYPASEGLDRLEKGYEPNADNRRVPVKADILTAAFLRKGKLSAALYRLTEDIINTLPAGAVYHRTDPPIYHISIVPIQDPPFDDSKNELTDKEREAAKKVVAKITAEQMPYNIRFLGLRFGTDGRVIAVFEDEGAKTELLRGKIVTECNKVCDNKISQARKKPLVSITLMRIFSNIEGEDLARLKAKAEELKDLSNLGLDMEIKTLNFYHETRRVHMKFDHSKKYKPGVAVGEPDSGAIHAIQLFDLVESSLNNEKAKFINAGNRLIGPFPARSASETNANTGALDEDMATAEIMQRIEKALTIIENPGAIRNMRTNLADLNRFEGSDAVKERIMQEQQDAMEERLKALFVHRDNAQITDELRGCPDLHCHTFYSDGYDSPAGVVFDAWRKGASAVAIADHNTFEGLEEAMKAGEILGIRVIPGIEFNFSEESLGIVFGDILAYFPAGNTKELEALMLDLKYKGIIEENNKRIHWNLKKQWRVIKKFNARHKRYGLEITPEDIKGRLGLYPNIWQLGEALFDKYGAEKLTKYLNDNMPSIDEELYRKIKERADKGKLAKDEDGLPVIIDPSAAGQVFIRTDSEVYIDEKELSGAEYANGPFSLPLWYIIREVKKAGGAVVLPHPIEDRFADQRVKDEKAKTDSIEDNIHNLFKEHIIDGIEHSGKYKTQDEAGKAARVINELTEEHPDLYVTVGSDYHASPVGRDLKMVEGTEGIAKKDSIVLTLSAVEKKLFNIKAVEDKSAEKLPEEVVDTIKYLKKNLNQLEVDGAVGSLIVLARKAKKENQKLIIGLETDWIPGINVGNSLQRQAITALMKEIDGIAESLRSMGLDNVEVIRGSGDMLASALLGEAEKTNTRMHNIVVMASADTINSDGFAALRNADENDRPFLTGIDPTELIKLYTEFGEVVSKQLYIRLASLLYMTLELAAGKEPPQSPIIVYYDKKMRILILLPKADPIDYEALKNNYAAEKAALAAA